MANGRPLCFPLFFLPSSIFFSRSFVFVDSSKYNRDEEKRGTWLRLGVYCENTSKYVLLVEGARNYLLCMHLNMRRFLGTWWNVKGCILHTVFLFHSSRYRGNQFSQHLSLKKLRIDISSSPNGILLRKIFQWNNNKRVSKNVLEGINRLFFCDNKIDFYCIEMKELSWWNYEII